MNKTEIVKVVLPQGDVLKTVKFVTSGCTLFFNAQHLLVKLTAKERCFFDYLCEHMRATTNDVMIDSHLKEHFAEQYRVYSSKGINLAEITKCIPTLKSLGLILGTHNKAHYIVNPKYAFKGYSSGRLLYLKKLIESRLAEGLSIAALINTPENEFRG